MYRFGGGDGFGQPVPVAPTTDIRQVPNGGLCRKNRRQRTVFTHAQLEILEKKFSQGHFPDYSDRQELADSFSMDERRIQVWFKNRRAKFRHEQKMVPKDEISLFGGPPSAGGSIKKGNKAPVASQPPKVYYYTDQPTDGTPNQQQESNGPMYSYADATIYADQPAINGPSDGMSNPLPNQDQVANFYHYQPQQQAPVYYSTYYTDLNSL